MRCPALVILTLALFAAAPASAAAFKEYIYLDRGVAIQFPAPPQMSAGTHDSVMLKGLKTTTYATHEGWVVTVGHHPDTHSKRRQRLLAYDPDEIDLFFIVDGDMTMYLIPSRAIAGRVRILLRTYQKYIVGNASGLLGAAAEEQRGDASTRASA